MEKPLLVICVASGTFQIITVPAIFDLTVAFTEGGAAPMLMSVLQGKSCKAQIFAKRIPLDQIPIQSEEQCAQWLQNHYKKKDDLYEDFAKNGRFAKGTEVKVPRRTNDLMWTFWGCFIVRKMIAVSEIDSTSSEYGKKKDS